MATAKYKKGKDGYFSTKVWDGTYVDGKKHRVNLRTKKSSKALENMVKEMEQDVQARKHVKQSDITFLQYARTWKKVYKNQRQNGTKSMYENIIEKHFSALENLKLQDVDRIHLQLLINNANGKSRTQQQILLTFKQILKSAVADHLFPANVMEDIFRNIEPIKYTPAEKRPLTDYERKAIFEANFNESDRIFVYILFGCGLRRGEALALTVFDFNLKNREVTINKSHEFVNDKPFQKNPKSSNGFRTIPIPDIIVPQLYSYISSLKLNKKIYLFTMQNGQPLTKSSYDKMWNRIKKRMQEVSTEEISGLTAHVFRHNYCTNLCYQIPTISIKKIAQLLGDTEKMVLEVYNHIILEKEDAITAIAAAMNE
jgi:integrase